MTDRVRTVTVVLDRDMRTDDVEDVLKAIRLLRFVSSAKKGHVVDHRDEIAREVARMEIRQRIYDALELRP